jgi:hypothetical protein
MEEESKGEAEMSFEHSSLLEIAKKEEPYYDP